MLQQKRDQCLSLLSSLVAERYRPGRSTRAQNVRDSHNAELWRMTWASAVFLKGHWNDWSNWYFVTEPHLSRRTLQWKNVENWGIRKKLEGTAGVIIIVVSVVGSPL